MKKLLLILLTCLFSFTFSNSNAQCPVNAGFNYSINNGYKVKFSSSSKTQNHYWTFGSNNGKGNTYNPTFTYPGPGTYTVCHTVWGYDSINNKTCSDTVCKTINVPQMCDADAYFSYRVSCDSVFFVINKQNSNSVNWGDGKTDQNVYQKWHKYSKAGTYTICHIASGYDSSTKKHCQDTVCKTITVKKCSNPCNADATFYYQLQGNTVYISSKQNTGSHVYYFGDGNSSKKSSPTHTYSKAGTYTICHDISYYDSINNKWCSDSSCQTITIKNNGCNADASFTTYHSGGGVHYFNPIDKRGTHSWTFGDGNSSQTGTHTYKKTGTYTVCHTISYYDSTNRKWCYDSTCKQVVYSPCHVNPGFVLNKLQNLTYKLTPSMKTGTHKWYVSDGNKNYTTITPTHTFSKPGNYTVCHEVSYYDSVNNVTCADSTCKTIKIQSGGCNADASFYHQTQGNVLYISSSQNTGTHKFTFGDGSSSTSHGPKHTYKKPGTYTVCHEVSYYDSINNKHCYDSTCKTIKIIGNGCNADASYTFIQTQGNIVKFIPKNKGTNHYWYFHDGTNSSKQQSPVYTFSKPGRYNVCHDYSYYDSSINKWCSDSVCQWVYVSTCYANAFFNPAVNGLTITAHDMQPNATHYYTFGDGNTSTKSNPKHTYKKSGYYDVCHYITVYDSLSNTSCSDTSCVKLYFRSNKPCDAEFQVYDSFNKVFFQSASLSRTAKHSWHINGSLYSTQSNPNAYFPNLTYKTYEVCHIVSEYDSLNRIICSDTVCKKLQSWNTSIQDDAIKASLKLYPNPVSDQLNLEFKLNSKENLTIKVINPLGQVEYSIEKEAFAGANKLTIPAQLLQNGMHYIQIMTSDGNTTKAFIKH